MNKDVNPIIPNPSIVKGMAGIIVAVVTGRKTFDIHENVEPDFIGLFYALLARRWSFLSKTSVFTGLVMKSSAP